MVINKNFKKLLLIMSLFHTRKASLLNLENAQCPLSTFPTFRIS